MRSTALHERLGRRLDGRDAADDTYPRGHAGPVEIVADLIAHQLRLLANLGAERRLIAARLVGDDGQRRLESMCEVADLGARPIDYVLIGLDQRVELGLKRFDFGRKLTLEVARLRPSGCWRGRARCGAAARDQTAPGTG